MKSKSLLAICSVCALAACGTFKHYTDPVAAQESVKCDYDKFSELTTCQMKDVVTCGDGELLQGSRCKFPSSHFYFKTVYGKEEATTVYGINGYVRARGWTNPYRVTDLDGKDFEFNQVTSKIAGCSQAGCQTNEYISIQLTRDYIAKHVNTGISMKIYGKTTGGVIITLPAGYVTGFNNYLKTIGK